MRQQINENPMVQAGLVGLLVLVCVFMLYTRVISGGSSGEAAAPPPATSSDTATTATTPSAAAPAETAVAPEDATGSEAPPVAPPMAPDDAQTGGLEAGKGMPQPVVDAYADDKAVVLLIVRQAGIDDRRVKSSVKALEADPNIAVFVTGARNVADYSQIANGVGVSQVPALIVMKPRSVSGDVPLASVSYGFRGTASVVQAVEDALYDGRNVPYFPE